MGKTDDINVSAPSTDLELLDRESSSSSILSERHRRVGTIAFVALAVTHLVFPYVAIDGVFLGLLAFAAIVYWVDIESIDALGIKGKVREIKAAKARVQGIDATQVEALTPPMPSVESATVQPPSVSHRAPFALNPPMNRLDRLIWGAEQIRIELILLAGNTGRLSVRKAWDEYSANELAQTFADSRLLPEDLLSAVNNVTQYRNLYVHMGRLEPALVDEASGLAMEALNKLRQVKRNYVRVRMADVSLFKDSSLSAPHEAKGVVLETLDSTGAPGVVAVYPRMSDYIAGRFVSWEWKPEQSYNDEAWYFDASTGQANLAFVEALTFAGREYPVQWGVEFRLDRFQVT